MRDQYAGDISDFLKFALLRALAADDQTIGVGWYYNPLHDGLQDGRHREYCTEEKWKSLDPVLLNALRDLSGRFVNALEQLPIWPMKTRFHRTPVPSAGNRRFWTRDMRAELQGASIIFLDPDNGVGNASERHTTVEEVSAMRQPGRTVVLIKFPGRENHHRQIEQYHSLLRAQTGALSVVTVRTCVAVAALNKRGLLQGVPRIWWFTLIDADDALIERATQFACRLNEIGKCSADVVCGPWSIDSASNQIKTDDRSIAVPSETPRDAVLRLMGVLERSLRALTSDESRRFHDQVEAHRDKFSDVAGVTDARRVRNALAHGENVSEERVEEAQAILEQALAEILPHCPERFHKAMRGTVSLKSPLPGNVPKPNQGDDVKAALPVCDWVYFATPSQEDLATTGNIVRDLGMIIRTVFNSAGIPIANVKQLRPGDTILLVHGGGGSKKPYRPMFSCTVVAPPHPIPLFEAFSYADESQQKRLRDSGYLPDPHLKKFTGIAIKVSQDLDRLAYSIPRPLGNNTIRRWGEVFGGTGA
jgi:hypothetical protein